MTWTLIALSVKEELRNVFYRSSTLCIGSIFVVSRFLRLGTIRSKKLRGFGVVILGRSSYTLLGVFFLHARHFCVDVCRLANTIVRHSKGIGMVLFENTPNQ
jgi:hypothetical protein